MSMDVASETSVADCLIVTVAFNLSSQSHVGEKEENFKKLWADVYSDRQTDKRIDR